MPDKVKTSLQNVKNVLRARLKARKVGRRAQAGEPAQDLAPTQRPRRRPPGGLEAVERAIDDCLGLARAIDREGLREVIALLRQARNVVVRRAGG